MLPFVLVILIQSQPLNGMPVTQKPTTTYPEKPTTTYPAQQGCFWEGKWYERGSDISRGSDGYGWCYGVFCNTDGGLIAWDDWNCATTSPPSTSPPYTPDPTTTGPPSPSTTAAPTTPPAPSPSTVPIPLGCLQNGAWYEPGSEISRESDGEGWCHGISCDANGKIVAWDDWKCEATDDPPSEETQVKPQGCYYENQWHPHGSIFEGSDSNGCKYGAICNIDGQVTRWDEFDCQSTKKQSESIS